MAVGILLLGVPLVITDQFFLHSLIMVLLFAYLSASWNIVGGLCGQLSLGHSAFVGIGAYTSSLLFLRWGVSPWLGMLVGGLLAALCALAIGYPCFRLRGPYFALSTLAFTGILLNLVLSTDHFAGFDVRGAMGIRLPLLQQNILAFQFTSKVYFYYTILALLAGVYGLSVLLAHSRLGSYWVAIREDQEVAVSVGVRPTRYKLYGAVLSGFLTALGGTFLAQLQLYVEPFQFFGAALSIEIALGAIVGGKGTILGPIVGAMLLRSLSETTRIYLGSSYAGAHLVLYGCLLIAIIMWMPHGVVPAAQHAFERLRRRGRLNQKASAQVAG
jgi:branched-chain amino acid transport system permease protein